MAATKLYFECRSKKSIGAIIGVRIDDMRSTKPIV